jgi:hypothetical protein
MEYKSNKRGGETRPFPYLDWDFGLFLAQFVFFVVNFSIFFTRQEVTVNHTKKHEMHPPPDRTDLQFLSVFIRANPRLIILSVKRCAAA